MALDDRDPIGRHADKAWDHAGIQAAFLHPVEAMHGDLGLICSCSPASPCDTVFLISHSGATAELMRLLPIVRPRVRSLVAITRDPESVLASSCHGWLDAGTGVNPAGLPKATTDEADSALPAPTSSVVSALAIGDALALTLSRLRTGWDADTKRRREEFYHCHPGGQLGIQVRTISLASSPFELPQLTTSDCACYSSVAKAARLTVPLRARSSRRSRFRQRFLPPEVLENGSRISYENEPTWLPCAYYP